MNNRWTKLNIFAAVFFASCVTVGLGSDFLYADDFGRIVRHIEASYHVHQNQRFAMGFAGLVVKFWHVAGVKSFKGAIFEDQHLEGTETDAKLDEIVAHASRSGWQPMVRSFSRRTGEHTYIYAQNGGSGNDLKLLVVSVERNEAAVIQVKLDPDKLEQFIEQNAHGSGRHGHAAMDGVMSFR
jgi:hypothetical protein